MNKIIFFVIFIERINQKRIIHNSIHSFTLQKLKMYKKKKKAYYPKICCDQNENSKF